VFHVFNWTFISFIQSILLFMISAPVYTILLASTIEPNLATSDLAYLAIELALVVTEYIADEQQWGKCANLHSFCHDQNGRAQANRCQPAAYQSAKQQYKTSAKIPQGFNQVDLDRGFVSSGLWGYSRHPNFAAEQSIWFVLYQWSCYSSKTLYNWAGGGPLFLIMLFQGSTWLTELITAGKYPEYREYQRQVAMFAPVRLAAYKAPPPKAPKVIRTSELAKRQQEKEKQQQK
jgi:steroid 5-alpha reductase family enzyme